MFINKIASETRNTQRCSLYTYIFIFTSRALAHDCQSVSPSVNTRIHCMHETVFATRVFVRKSRRRALTSCVLSRSRAYCNGKRGCMRHAALSLSLSLPLSTATFFALGFALCPRERKFGGSVSRVLLLGEVEIDLGGGAEGLEKNRERIITGRVLLF